MRNSCLWIILFFSFTTVCAQERKYTMAEATNGLRQNLAPSRLMQLEWIPGEQAYSQLTVTAEKKFVWEKTLLPSGKKQLLFRVSNMSWQLFHDSTLRWMPVFHWLSPTEAWFSRDSNYYRCSFAADGSVNYSLWFHLPAAAENVFIHEKSRHAAYTIDNNLYLRNSNGNTVKITNDTAAGIVNGQSVHREEFGIDHGIFFSPDGTKVAFYRMDQQMVSDYPIPDWSVTPAQVKQIKYPMAGRTSHQVTLGVYDIAAGSTRFMQTGTPADQYLTAVSWAPDGQQVYIALLNRAQNHVWFNQYQASTGSLVKTLFEETHPRYIQPRHSISFLPWNKDQFIWWSERDGYQHLYLYNTGGQLVQQLTKGNWMVNELTGFREKTREIIYTSTEASALEKQVYIASIDGKKKERLTTVAGWHDATISTNGLFLLDKYSSETVPYVVRVSEIKGKYDQQLHSSPDPLKDFDRPVIRPVQLKAADDSTILYGKLILPTHFDSTRKYPVIVYLYNGPNVQLIRNSFPASGNLWYEYMAQQGFIVFTMDGRGSSNRGLAFEQATFRQLGTVEMEDQLKGVDYLKALPYVDAQRMGVHGWSFGGFMTTSLMLRHPDVFKVGVAGGPVIDWRMYEVMYTERYMDTPEENPEGYAASNLLTKTKNLKGKLLMIHGTNDDVVVWQHSIDFLKACVDNGTQIDYFVYPGHLHNVLGKDRVHLMQKITDYFKEKL
ncbi:S9 family peptidase [Filimonas effusa]|uniref:S9 family peptidase n=1 Tax=Filimonas effusa TaxID=2508721 RepID=A0A4Q1D166_9BACT|nr:DPP IV N-terminal domain-containing protein [Filimonas effusa]RXK80735.1 S9 family peptidase [Filimonas effusa]